MQNQNVQKPSIFVLMPFDDTYRDVYQLGIKLACDAIGVDVERADDEIREGNIYEHALSKIREADLIIAVLSGKSPNVIYEIGFAHALEKKQLCFSEIRLTSFSI